MHAVHDAVLDFITASKGDFDSLALAVFTHHYESVLPYRQYCERHDRSPRSVRTWRDVPPVPVLAFKETDLCCGPPERVFLTTGTSRGSEIRGRHVIPDLRLYRTAALAGLRRFLFPDVARLQIVSMIPSSAEAPTSSLSQMVSWAIEEFGTMGSTHVASPSGIDYAACADVLRASERNGTSLCLMTTTAALIHLLDYCRKNEITFRLPHGSRLMDTGGSKGSPRSLSRKGLLHACWKNLAIPGYFCVNEYGMAELSSQFYENVIRDRFGGTFARRALVPPPWTRVRVLDPAVLEDVAPGQRGLLCLYDLANAGTALAILTEDIGRIEKGGFEVCGRVTGAEARGCSLSVTEWQLPA